MNTNSCDPKEPFIKLQGDGQAAILNYNLPQNSEYNFNGFIGLGLDSSLFKIDEVRQTDSPSWTALAEVKEMNKDGIQVAIRNENNMILDHAVLNRNLRLQVKRLDSSASIRLLDNVKKAANLQNAQLKLMPQAEAKDRMATLKLPEVEVPHLKVTELVHRQSINEDIIAQKINRGYMPIAVERLSKKPEIIYLPKPKAAHPEIFLVMHYKMVSFLGDYGAGQTIKSIYLLPGERSTITMRTYKHNETTREQSQNVLDSFSETSADDLQNIVEKQEGYSTGLSTEGGYSRTGGWNVGANVGINLGCFSLGVGGGGGESTTVSTSINTATQEQSRIIDSSVSHHVSASDHTRQIEINTETTSRNVVETEESIVRHIENINQSRVLNFVFRQLLQSYISITYLDQVTIQYYNGFPESRRTASLSDLDGLLSAVLKDNAAITEVKNKIYRSLCNIKDYQDTMTGFIEKVTEEYDNCINPSDPSETVTYVRKRIGLKQTYEDYTVPGIIMNVAKRTLRTDSAVVDALLGQGEALDCYNQNLQSQAVKAAELNNIRYEQDSSIMDEQWTQEKSRVQQAMALIDSITDPAEKAKLYKKVFGDCCDVPQSGGCGCGCPDKPEA